MSKKPRSSRRAVLLVAMLAALVTIAVIIVLVQPYVAGHLQLRELRNDPRLVERWILDPDLAPNQRAALQRFLEEDPGKEELFSLYLAEYDRRQFDNTTIEGVLQSLPQDNWNDGFFFLTQGDYGFTLRRNGRPGRSHRMMNVPQNVDRRRAILSHVPALYGQRFFRGGPLPNLEFEVVAVSKEKAAPPSWSDDDGAINLPRFTSHVCYFRIRE